MSVEQNVHLDNQNMSGSHLEGEDLEFIETKSDLPSSAPNTAVTTAPSQPVPLAEPQPTGTDTTNPSESETEVPSKRVRKPSRCIHDILD